VRSESQLTPVVFAFKEVRDSENGTGFASHKHITHAQQARERESARARKRKKDKNISLTHPLTLTLKEDFRRSKLATSTAVHAEPT
jgi:hypothetical protein